ncbi:MAG: nitrous oxidase accessory protein [Saprospiraceae bacterium]|jgi:nitrous oxidase accessory protein
MKQINRFTFLTLLFLSFASLLFARTIEVCNTCEAHSITKAIEIAQDGDVLLIGKGIYKEGNITINKALTLRGIDLPILDGNNETEVLTIVANDVTLDGLQIQNVGTSYVEDRAGIRLRKVKNCIIKNCVLLNTFFGIYLEHASDIKIINNQVHGQAEEEMSSGNAIHLWYCKRIEVRGNKVSHHRDGIYLEFVDRSLVTKNISEDNLRYGLHFMFSNEDEYTENVFRRNGAGVAVMFSKKINMIENTFEFNWGKASYGLLLKEIYDAKISNNLFRENTIGIFVEGSTRINYLSNDFVNNGWAMKVSGGCLDNKINNNNFISNTFDLSINNVATENSFDSNYWSDYAGYDLDRDGVGDVPYRPVKLFNYIVNQTPEATILLRSLFIDLINFSEKVSPVFTPKNVLDNSPLMKKIIF